MAKWATGNKRTRGEVGSFEEKRKREPAVETAKERVVTGYCLLFSRMTSGFLSNKR